jgi:hypothetical protein
LLNVPTVYHIGTLEPRHRGRHGESLEGQALSVSCCPHAWQTIAELGGNPWWKLQRSDAQFIDLYALREEPKILNRFIAWGLRCNLIESRELWRAWSVDEEGDWRYSLHSSEDEARFESCDEAPQGQQPVEPLRTWVGTAALAQRVGWRSLAQRDAIDFLALALIEDTQPDIDGLWWREDYDPDVLSAPRGGILPSRLAQWRRQRIEPAQVDDCEAPDGQIRPVRATSGISRRKTP